MPPADASEVRLMAITDVKGRGVEATLAAMQRLCAEAQPGTVAVQLREREASVNEVRSWAQALRAMTRQHGQLLLINDRCDLALVVAADGVHLGEGSVAAREARALFLRHALSPWITRARHLSSGARDPDVDAEVFAPIVSARKGAPALGYAALALEVQQSGCPVFALGGVTPPDVTACLGAGARGIAAIGAVYDTPTALLAQLGIAR